MFKPSKDSTALWSYPSFPVHAFARVYRICNNFLQEFRSYCIRMSGFKTSSESIGPIAISLLAERYTRCFGRDDEFSRTLRVQWRRQAGQPAYRRYCLQQAEIGIIGGSGLYSMPGLSEVREVKLETPFGEPSDDFILGNLEGRKVAFLARHGRGHRLLPSELNFRANIYAMKMLGVERILSVSAVGSLKEEHKPTDFVIPDQFIDRTYLRTSTFFGNGIVGHVAFGDPVCGTVAASAAKACNEVGVVGKLGGTYVCMEGPQFSTKAESNLYRSWGADVVGMTNLQEAKLAREAEICYATVAMVTDYDCWHPHHDSVTIEQIVAVLHQNAENAAKVVRATVGALPSQRSCGCVDAAKFAILTQPSAIPAEAKERLKLLFGKYFV